MDCLVDRKSNGAVCGGSLDGVNLGDGELISSKKVVNHKTRLVETRIQRQIVMEDGKVIADSGPQITTRTKEDNWTEESENCAKKGLPMEVNPIESAITKVKGSPTESVKPITVSRVNKVVAGDEDKVVSEKIETKNTTREAKQERFQYHDESITELSGFDIHQKALASPNALITIDCDTVDVKSSTGENIFSESIIDRIPKGKLIHYSSKGHKVTDKEEVKEVSKLGVNGQISKETVRTHHHEEEDDDEEPESTESKEISSHFKPTLIQPTAQPKLPEKESATSLKIEYSPLPSHHHPAPGTYPVSQSNTPKYVYTNSNKQPHHGHPHQRHPHTNLIYDTGRTDHTTKWLESHFGSSDDAKETGLNESTSSGSIAYGRGRPRQRINPTLSQSYEDEAYYSRSNTLAGCHSQSASSRPANSIEKLDCLPLTPKSTITTSRDKRLDKGLINHSKQLITSTANLNTNTTIVGLNKMKGTKGSGDSISTGESSLSDYHEYHHSSEGSLSPSGLMTNRTNKNSPPKPLFIHNRQSPCQCMMVKRNLFKSESSIVNKRWSSNQQPGGPERGSVDSKNNKRNGIQGKSDSHLRTDKHRVPKEDASVQALLSDEGESDHGLPANDGGSSSGRFNDRINNNGGPRPRPKRMYYFGENVQPTNESSTELPRRTTTIERTITTRTGNGDLIDSNNNRENGNHSFRSGNLIFDSSAKLKSTSITVEDNGHHLTTRKGHLKVDPQNGGHAIEPNNKRSTSNYWANDDERFSRSLNCLNEPRTITGPRNQSYYPSSRTDVFQTRDHRGLLSNWRSTINLQSNGLTKLESPLYRSKDDFYSVKSDPNGARNGLLPMARSRKHLGSFNNLLAVDHHSLNNNNSLKYDPTVDPLRYDWTHSTGSTPLRQRKGLLGLKNLLNSNYSAPDESPKPSSKWPVFTAPTVLSETSNPKGTFVRKKKYRAPNPPSFVAH